VMLMGVSCNVNSRFVPNYFVFVAFIVRIVTLLGISSWMTSILGLIL